MGLRHGIASAFKNAETSMIGEAIQEKGNKNTPPFIRRMGCIGQVFATASGTTIFIRGALEKNNPENAVTYCAVGLGIIFFSLLKPAISKLFKR